jgi:D-alanyl-D-alanine carboxypeptidase
MKKYLGIADRTWDIPVDKNSKNFDIASVNKSMIAALVVKAAEEGKWALDDTLEDLLQKLGLEGRFDPNISLHQMLCHTAGLPGL